MKVSLISGILNNKDAISASTRAKALALKEIGESLGEDLEIRVFVYSAEYDLDGRVRTVSNLNELLFDEHFLASDLVIYDFGIFNELFNSIYLAPPSAIKVVHFHNVTPPEFVQSYNKDFIHRSLIQRINLLQADIVLSTSEFSTGDLIDFGVTEEKVFQLHPVPISLESQTRMSGTIATSGDELPGTIEAVCVGRFVHSKGLHDLLKAIRQTLDSGAGNIHLSLIGSSTLSDPTYFEELKSLIQEMDLSGNVDILEGLSDEERDACYQRSQLFLTASYHEGFCVPVIEALKYGCYVIAYDAGNLRNVVNGFGNTVETGDVDALANKIIDYMRIKSSESEGVETVLFPDAGPMSEAEFFRKADEYLLSFSHDEFKERLLEILSKSFISS